MNALQAAREGRRQAGIRRGDPAAYLRINVSPSKESIEPPIVVEFQRQRLGFLPKLERVKLVANEAWVSQDTNQVVKHLMMWRNKVYAHRDIRKTVSGDLAADYPATHDDVAQLLEQGFWT